MIKPMMKCFMKHVHECTFIKQITYIKSLMFKDKWTLHREIKSQPLR